MNIGIWGSGAIVSTMLNALEGEEDIRIKGLLCRPGSRDRAADLCKKFAIDKLYTDEEAFLSDSDFDTVYIATINSLHFPAAKAALLSGKNVICEKPFTANYAQAKELVDLAEAKGLFLFEALMLRYNENYDIIKERVKDLGDITLVLCNFSQYSGRFDAYTEGRVMPAFDPDCAGGCLYDLNSYNVQFVAGIFGVPKTVQYSCNKGFNGVDLSGVLVLDYGDFKAVCTGAKDSNGELLCSIQGRKGYIEYHNHPSLASDVVLRERGEEPVIIDVADRGDYMKVAALQFKAIADIIKAEDKDRARADLEISLIVADILEKARKQVGLSFPGD